MNTGRNDPCPCGSGNKFKRCCGAPRRDTLAEAAGRVRAMQQVLEPRIVRHARETFGGDFLDRAWADFLLDAKGIEPRGPEDALFVPWMLYRWLPGTDERKGRRRRAASIPLAQSFLEFEAKSLSTAERDFVAMSMLSPVSFHEILDVEPGRTLRMRDVFLESERLVFEQSGSQTLQIGDLLYGRVVALGDLALVVGSGSLALPPETKIPVLALRKQLRKNLRDMGDVALLAADEMLRGVYFDLREPLVNPPRPILQNTDGEPLELQTLTWKINSTEAAFRALLPLSHVASEAEIRKEAELDADGRVRRVEFSWDKLGNKMNKGWSNTVLGRIVIDSTSLMIEVNSARRAERIRAEVSKRLGRGAVGPSIRSVAMEAPLPRRMVGSSTNDLGDIAAWREQPELVEVVRKQMDSHWDSWITDRIPALGNKKPVDLVKTKEGREMVEALLLSFERRPPPPTGGESYDFNRVRARLGLPTRSRSD